jgi:electron transport complex protein RnfC
MKVPAVEIENDGQSRRAPGVGEERSGWRSLTPVQIKDAVQAAGLVGMGGATFPTHVKLSPPADKPMDTVILNGSECEPYLTADHRLMLEHSAGIVEGLGLFMKAVGAKCGIIAVEANKRDAFEAMSKAASGESEVTCAMLPVKYPQGAEKQLIKTLTRREVPSGGLPMDVGALVHNVGTAYAAYEAVAFGKPLYERVTSVTGSGVLNPANFLVPVGTSIAALIDRCGVDPEANKLICGGPMMGFAQYTAELPVIKGTSGVVVLKNAPVYVERSCIRCGRCVDNCPMGLNPSRLSILADAGAFDQMEEWNALDCIECGCCAFGCPARRRIVQHVKTGKMWIQAERAKAKAAAAKAEADKKAREAADAAKAAAPAPQASAEAPKG